MALEEEPTLEEASGEASEEEPVGLEWFHAIITREVGLEGDFLEEVPLALLGLMSMRGAEAGVNPELPGEGEAPPGAGAEVGP